MLAETAARTGQEGEGRGLENPESPDRYAHPGGNGRTRRLAETAARAGQEERKKGERTRGEGREREGSRARGTSRESRTGGNMGGRRGQRWTKWHESGQFGTRVDKMAGMEGVARRLQYSG